MKDQTTRITSKTSRTNREADGYYWARHYDGSRFVVLQENGLWYAPGMENPLLNFSTDQIVCPVKRADN